MIAAAFHSEIVAIFRYMYIHIPSHILHRLKLAPPLINMNFYKTGLLQLKVDVAPLAYEAIIPTIDEYMPRMAVVNDPKKKNKTKLFKSMFCLYPLINLFIPPSR